MSRPVLSYSTTPPRAIGEPRPDPEVLNLVDGLRAGESAQPAQLGSSGVAQLVLEVSRRYLCMVPVAASAPGTRVGETRRGHESQAGRLRDSPGSAIALDRSLAKRLINDLSTSGTPVHPNRLRMSVVIRLALARRTRGSSARPVLRSAPGNTCACFPKGATHAHLSSSAKSVSHRARRRVRCPGLASPRCGRHRRQAKRPLGVGCGTSRTSAFLFRRHLRCIAQRILV